jgi:hypothetical protein
MVRRMALLVLLLGAGLLPARPAAAAGAFGPPITVMTAPCPEAFVHADAAAGLTAGSMASRASGAGGATTASGTSRVTGPAGPVR